MFLHYPSECICKNEKEKIKILLRGGKVISYLFFSRVRYATISLELLINGGFIMGKMNKFQIKSRIDGLTLNGQYIESQAESCRGIVQIVHGMCEHKERYEEFMTYLAEQGFSVFTHDKRGHGESVKDAGDLGYMYGGGSEAYLEDILQVNEFAREKVPGVPVILFGHSMGSLGVRAFTKIHDDKIDALIVCGSPSKNPALGAGMFLAKLQRTILGAKYKAELLKKISFGGYEARFKNEPSRVAWLCSVPEEVKAYEDDPLCGFTFTTDGYVVLFELMQQTYDEKNWLLSKPKLPIHFIAGENDPCIENKEKFAEAIEYMIKAGYPDVSSKLYQGMRHEILNERERKEVFNDVLAFLESKGF